MSEPTNSPPQPQPQPQPRLVAPYLVLAVTVIITAAAAAYVGVSSQTKDLLRFQASVQRARDAINNRLDTHIALLRGGGGLFAAHPFVSKDVFHQFVERLDLPGHYPGVLAIGYAGSFAPEERPKAEAFMRTVNKTADFHVWPEGSRERYVPVVYIEPHGERNLRVLGYDMFSEPTRRAAIERARDSGVAAGSGKVFLKQETDQDIQPGFLIYLPVYKGGDVPTDLAKRREKIAGFVYSPFRAGDFFRSIFGDAGPPGLTAEIFDGADTRDDSLLFRSGQPDPDARFARNVNITVEGHPWTLRFSTTPEFEQASGYIYAVLTFGAGLVVAAVLFALSLSQSRAQWRAERNAAALRASESKLRRLVESNVVGVSFRKLDGRIIDANDEFFRLIGYTREEFVEAGIGWKDVIAPEFLDADARAVERIRLAGVCPPFEKQLIHKDGSRVPVVVAMARLEGSTDDCVAINIDLTPQKNAERLLQLAKENADAARAEAETANRLKDEFLATVSHELRTPLNAILGWSQLLRTGRANLEDLTQGLETIERSAKAQAQLVEDLLDVSRIVSGKLRLDVQQVALPPIIEAAIESVRHAADARGVTIEKHLDETVGPVAGDPGRLQQIAWNLLSNAVKFTPRDGRVTITLTRVNSDAVFTVTDTGRGIERDFLPHVFDRFRQADAGTTRAYGGLGLGLAIVRNLVELHGGTVHAHSEGPDTGASFTVSLPLSTAATTDDDHAPAAHDVPAASESRDAASNVENDPPKSALAGVRVLIVEDDSDARDLIERILKNAGADVTAASSAQQALDLFAQSRPDILVSDIGMPGEDGYTLLARLRMMERDSERVPAVALTALARPDDRARAIQAGYQVHLAKPIEPVELTAVIVDLAKRT